MRAILETVFFTGLVSEHGNNSNVETRLVSVSGDQVMIISNGSSLNDVTLKWLTSLLHVRQVPIDSLMVWDIVYKAPKVLK